MRPARVLVIAVLTSTGAAIRAQAQQPVTRCESCQLRLDVQADKVTYEVSEPIVLSIRLTNTGTSQLQVLHTSDITGRHDGARFEVLDEDASSR
jgi:hypothetical protein